MIKVYIWKCVIKKDKSLISYIIKGQIYLMAQTFIASYFIAWTIINYKNSLYFDPYSEHIAQELNFSDEKSGQCITMVTWSYTCQLPSHPKSFHPSLYLSLYIHTKYKVNADLTFRCKNLSLGHKFTKRVKV